MDGNRRSEGSAVMFRVLWCGFEGAWADCEARVCLASGGGRWDRWLTEGWFRCFEVETVNHFQE